MKVNETLRLSVFARPDKSSLGGIKVRAEKAMELDMISTLPTIEVEESETKGFWVIAITCKTEDQPFWYGFYLSRDWCVSNRLLTVGCD